MLYELGTWISLLRRPFSRSFTRSSVESNDAEQPLEIPALDVDEEEEDDDDDEHGSDVLGEREPTEQLLALRSNYSQPASLPTTTSTCGHSFRVGGRLGKWAVPHAHDMRSARNGKQFLLRQEQLMGRKSGCCILFTLPYFIDFLHDRVL